MFKVNNKDTRTIKTPGVFISNFEYILHLVLLFILLTLVGKCRLGNELFIRAKTDHSSSYYFLESFHDGSIVFVVITIVIFVYTNTSYYFCAKFSLFQSYK